MSAFQLLFQQPMSASGALQDSGILTAFKATDSLRSALFWLSDEADKSLHLGYFSDETEMRMRADRFIENPETTPALPLTSDQVKALRSSDQTETLPSFSGVFGTAFSGYLLKADSGNQHESMNEQEMLMLFYTADYRSELLGVLTPEAALKIMTEHYDNRRKRCMLC